MLPETRTANSLTGLFNLRHNLSIDGQPLSLPLYADRADPSQLLSSMVLSSQESNQLPNLDTLPLWRFPMMLERARNTVAQLSQFGTTLLNLVEHQDADELNSLLIHQGMELVTQSIRNQERMVDEVAADREVIEENRRGALERLAMYRRLWEENISRQEQSAMDMQTKAGYSALSAQGFLVAASITDMLPNIFGFAVGGNRWGAGLQATAESVSIGVNAALVIADKMNLSESYRRRREEWEIQRDAAESELKQPDAQLRALDIRHEAAELQVEYLRPNRRRHWRRWSSCSENSPTKRCTTGCAAS
ncbi:MAG: Unknown, probable insecticidal toxin [uncultured Paraburkholderia sp.]|nr:MAG: Unknown, probable insecticidal toxin [uncultured Paraburkholderia sp.]